MKIRVSLHKDNKEIWTSEKDFNLWSEVSQVVIGEEIFHFDAKATSPVEIVFSCYSEGKTVKVATLEELSFYYM